MSLYEPRCLVCGAPMPNGAPFEKEVRDSEVCSDECYEIYMYDDSKENIEGGKNGVQTTYRRTIKSF